MLWWAVAPEHLWSQSPNKTWATFPLTDPNCQGAVSCQTWLRASLLGETEGHRFLSLLLSLSHCVSLSHTLSLSPLFFQLPVCFLSQTVHSTSMTQLWKQVDRGTPTRSIDNTYFLSVVSRRRKSEPPWALILEPQMAGGGLRGLDFIKELTLIIVNCKKRGGFHCLCNLCTIYTHTN